QGGQRCAGNPVDPVGDQCRAEEPAADRTENLSGSSTARRTCPREPEVRRRPMLSGRHFLLALVLGIIAVPAHAATIQIVMENLVFTPAEGCAKVGDTIEGLNKDVFVHTATAKNGDFDVTQPPKKTVTSVLKKAGTIEYYCRYHPNMKAVLKI